MRIDKGADRIFLGVVFFLVLFGFLALASASLGAAVREGESFYSYLYRQIIFGFGVGGILFWIGIRTHYKFWQKISFPLFLAGIVLLLLVYVPQLGFAHGGAKRWLNFGFFFFQPSEFMKLVFIAYLASWMSARKEQIKSMKFGLLPFIVMAGLVGVLLVLEPDVGTFGVIAITSMFLFFIGGAKKSHIMILIAAGLILLSVLVALEPYRLTRFLVFINPEYDLSGAGYQLHQSLIAIGSGGFFGRGFGKSLQKFDYLPESTGDSIFAVIAEEFGFFGVLAIVGAFMFFLWRGLHIARHAPDNFGRLLASGIVILIVVQALIHMGALIGLLPLTGLPLVFISQGGSSLALSLLAAGIVLNISKYCQA
ncbi:MAG: putative lipid II flippase FtsW [Patescibacteria group bacterium]